MTEDLFRDSLNGHTLAKLRCASKRCTVLRFPFRIVYTVIRYSSVFRNFFVLPPLTHYVWYRSEDDNGRRLILSLYIQPGAKRTEAVGLHGDALKIKLAALPLRGAANDTLLKFLAEIFCVPLCQVKLKHGAKSRRKVVEIWQTALGPEALFEQPTDSGMC